MEAEAEVDVEADAVESQMVGLERESLRKVRGDKGREIKKECMYEERI